MHLSGPLGFFQELVLAQAGLKLLDPLASTRVSVGIRGMQPRNRVGRWMGR